MLYYLDDFKNSPFIKTNKFHDIISTILIRHHVLKMIKKIKNLTKIPPISLYVINKLNLWGFIFCSINKKTSLNTFISVHLSDTHFA